MKTIPYSTIRDSIKVGDVIGCRGGGLISRLIRKIKGGEWDFSHVALIIRSSNNEATGRVEVFEALSGGGMQRNYLSKHYRLAHGKLFWVNLNCNKGQQKKIMKIGVEIQERKVEYDFFTTWFAMFQPIFVDVKKFNCSEFAWYMLTEVGRLLKRFKDDKEIAPVPGDLPTWAGIEPVHIDMNN
jgi:hypothetical protein